MKNNSLAGNMEILKIKISYQLKEDIKTLAYIKGITMTKLVTEILANACQKAREEIEEIRSLRAKK
ncbi:hypothetical protein [Cyanobacterium sp. Dongsha4]|uniref:hypothetical protein n=1 Tax=Cyanobacterium sp. DS4 TaxID=2878255 RepID=UPI002E823A72|nr:hypothetical protein [Cyanobacterium sp. Dongsha4]WVL02524.1 hypothetical protein Dongsha4_18785 [Cyanobacterium sp. Dongsha4]